MSLPALVEQRGITPEVWNALKNSIFPGAADDSIAMAWDYCKARQLDILLKPVHLVPMYIKDKESGDKGSMRDVVMPGIGLYRIQADRAGNYAGMSAPKYGPMITETLSGVTVTFPEWCEMTVTKIVNGREVNFTATEYWIENYATAGKDTQAPNSMWRKRPRAQLSKCTEAQALRKAWPELGAQPTAEEMEGKTIEVNDQPKSNISTNKNAGQIIDQTPENIGDSITADQIGSLRAAIEMAGITEIEFCANKKIAIGCIEELPQAKFSGAINMLKKFAGQQ